MRDEDVQALANIAVIGSTINIRISAKDPLDYLDRYKISDAKLAQQFIPSDRAGFTIPNYSNFIKNRAEELSRRSNEFLAALSRGLQLGSAGNPAE